MFKDTLVKAFKLVRDIINNLSLFLQLFYYSSRFFHYLVIFAVLINIEVSNTHNRRLLFSALTFICTFSRIKQHIFITFDLIAYAQYPVYLLLLLLNNRFDSRQKNIHYFIYPVLVSGNCSFNNFRSDI